VSLAATLSMYASAAKVHLDRAVSLTFDLRLEIFSTMPTHVTNIYTKCNCILSTKYRPVCVTRNRCARTADGHTYV